MGKISKVEQNLNSINSYMKDNNEESCLIQANEEDGHTHIRYEHKKYDGKEVIITEIKEWII